MTERLVFANIGLATVLLVIGFALSAWWPWALLVGLLGLLWLLGQWRWRWRRGWMPSVGLALFVAAAALGLWLGVAAGWILFGAVAALSAWDLANFAQRMGAARVHGRPELERCHLRRLLVVDALGLLLAGFALLVRVRLAFGGVLLLGLLFIWAMSRVVTMFRQESH